MALEPAGVSLQAQGFNKYIRQLDKIDKAQQDAFDVGPLTKSINKLTDAIDDLTSELVGATKAADKFDDELKNTEKSSKNFTVGLKGAAAGLVAFATGATAQFTAESAKISAQFEGQRKGLNNLAASFGQSGAEIQSAIQEASKGTLSGLQAINAANQGLLLGVAKTPEEFANLTNAALVLGRTLGLESTQAIEQFTSALGRQSLLILDNFGISAKQVNAEIERLAQADFGKARNELTEAQKQATFMKAALNIAGQAAATIGEEAGKAQASFDALTAAGQDLQVTFGTAVQPGVSFIAEKLTEAAKTAQLLIAILSRGFVKVSSIAGDVLTEVGIAFSRLGQLIQGDISFAQFRQPLREFNNIVDEATAKADEKFKQVASTIAGVSFDDTGAKELAEDLGDVGDNAEKAAQDLTGYQNALRQAQDLQLSFARAAEDAARKLARANEDIARRQARDIVKLEEKQAKDRDRLLRDQAKQLDKFEKDRLKQIADAEKEIQRERKEAGKQRKRDQERLQRELLRAQERFNLSQLQSERRFRLQEQRLIAEGDVIGLKELREDFSLQQQEEKENFTLSQREQKESAKEQQREQTRDLEKRLVELKTNLEDQRAELLASFDEQLIAQQEAQNEARFEQQRAFAEQAADREIALAREEEDRRISQARQLEDLGRSFAEQEGITAEGAAAIAAELEKVFGIDGVADQIMTGFTEKTENEFAEMFDNLESIASSAPPISLPISPTVGPGIGTLPGRIGGVQEFQEGGVVPGSGPQLAVVHGGETIIPTSHSMQAPLIPSQSLNVNMSGGFNITGDGQANEAILQAAASEMTENFRIAVERLARRN